MTTAFFATQTTSNGPIATHCIIPIVSTLVTPNLVITRISNCLFSSQVFNPSNNFNTHTHTHTHTHTRTHARTFKTTFFSSRDLHSRHLPVTLRNLAEAVCKKSKSMKKYTNPKKWVGTRVGNFEKIKRKGLLTNEIKF